jgi:fatty-acyl-CoA synthase
MNLGEWASKRALSSPAGLFLKQGDLVWDNRQFNARVNQVARVLGGLGVKKGARVAVLMVNSADYLAILFACAKLGAILVPLNTNLAAPELEHMLRDSGPRVLIGSPACHPKLEALKARGLPVPHVFVQDGGGTGGDADFAARADAAGDGEPEAPEPVGDADPLVIMYTSGTTGAPKGALLTHGNFLFGAIHSLLGYGINAGYRSLVVAPLFHIGALAASATPVIYAGGALILREFDNPSDILETIARERINYMFAVPVMYDLLTKAPRWPQADFSQVHFFIAGGAPMPVPLLQRYQAEKGVRFPQGYGMTETLRITSLDLEEAARKAGSIGKEVFHTWLRIVDEEGREVAPGEVGELTVRGPTVFQGYWQRPRETAAALRDGWFHTGDLGRRDAEGFLYIVGRKTDMIISSGENIYPAEVERAIEALPQVAAAAAVGLADPKRGEVVAAFVQLREGCRLGEDELLQALEASLAPYKRPRKVCFVEDFPRNRGGKILKNELKARLQP